MDFEWDEAKNRSNIRKHGFDFATWTKCFAVCLLWTPTRERLRERWTGSALSEGAHVRGGDLKHRFLEHKP